MKIHAVINYGKGITIHYQSCYCKLSFENGDLNFSCGGWNSHLLNFPSHHDKKDNDDDHDIISVQCTADPECEAGDFIVCVHDVDKKIYLVKFKKLMMVMMMKR